jgi:hypothetical protein
MVPDEKTLRRDGVNPGACAPVVLADAQAWLLPKPWLAIGPPTRAERPDSIRPGIVYDDELESMIELIEEAEGDGLYVSAAGLAAHMLAVNYVLDDGQMSEVLEYREGSTWMGEVATIAAGLGGSRSFSRWRRLSLMAQGALPGWILLEDANDLLGFLEFSKRTIPRSRWADESIAAQAADQVEGLF